MSGLRPWKPGQSGNPGGRPKGTREFSEACRAVADNARKVLAEVMLDDKAPASSRVTAATVLIERAYGRPPADVSLNVKRNIDDFSDEELAALMETGGEESGAEGALPPPASPPVAP